MTALQREQEIAVRHMGMSATNEQIAAVERLIATNYREQQSLQALQDAQQFFADTAFSGLMDLIDGSQKASDAVRNLAKQTVAGSHAGDAAWPGAARRAVRHRVAIGWCWWFVWRSVWRISG